MWLLNWSTAGHTDLKQLGYLTVPGLVIIFGLAFAINQYNLPTPMAYWMPKDQLYIGINSPVSVYSLLAFMLIGVCIIILSLATQDIYKLDGCVDPLSRISLAAVEVNSKFQWYSETTAP